MQSFIAFYALSHFRSLLLDAKMKVFELLKFKFCFFQNLSPVFSTFMFESFD